MTEIHVIDLIDTTHEGPAAMGTKEEEQQVHLHQGSLDGACGPYCLLISLLICGLADRTAVLSSRYSKQTSIGKVLERIHRGQGLFRDGTSLDEIQNFIDGAFTKRLGSESFKESGVGVKSFVERHIKENHPVIMGMEYPGCGHWVVAVGLEYSKEKNGTLSLCRILVLDPGELPSKVSAWNGVVEARASGGAYPYTWWTGDRKVQLDQAIAIWKK